MSKTIYDLVYSLLRQDKELRDSDKKLYWRVCIHLGFIQPRAGLFDVESITFDNFMKAPAYQSVRISRQQIQQAEREKIATGELKVEDSVLSSEQVAEWRSEKAEEKGTHIFREEV